MAVYDNLPNAIREGMRFSEEGTETVVKPALEVWNLDAEEVPDEAWDIAALGMMVLRSQLGEDGLGKVIGDRGEEMTEELYLHLNLMHDGEEYLEKRAGENLRKAMQNCKVKGGVATLNVEGTKAMLDCIIYTTYAGLY